MSWSCVGEEQGLTEEAEHLEQLAASYSDPIGHTPSPFTSVRRRPVFSEMLHSLGMKCSTSRTLECLWSIYNLEAVSTVMRGGRPKMARGKSGSTPNLPRLSPALQT